ncbi:hypothetical protein [Chitinophaga sp. HK235]|uniref:hypothetical protein n=1 Tax=Chitinophaga sp. HK235 TaxID=2952571 RepID=UPI001BAD3604|nr:hypothetical protein [Chitinophaga sp. HK235]
MELILKTIAKLWRTDKLLICLFTFFLTVLLLSNYYGYRICNCTSTEKWEPGKSRSGSSHGGVNRFYHK